MADAAFGAGEAVGNVPHDDPDSGNPLKGGGRADFTRPTEISADGDRVNAWFDRYGRQVVIPWGDPGTTPPDVSTLTTTSNAALIAAPGANLAIVVVSILVTNMSATLTRVDIKDNTTIRVQGAAAADGGGYMWHGRPFKLATNVALNGALSVAVTDVRVTTSYYIEESP